MTEYGECKAGTVRTLGQAGAAPYVGITQELQCIVYIWVLREAAALAFSSSGENLIASGSAYLTST